MPLNVGVLIIGSLAWDRERSTWRDNRLHTTRALAVTAPIRYGRRSQNRGKTFTMVFSRGCPLGRAIIAPCALGISNIGDLVTEAEHLWAAESNKPIEQCISASWGRIVVLPNPSSTIPLSLMKDWAERVSGEPTYGDVPQAEREGQLVSKEGILQIAWPQPIGTVPADLPDLLLATATHPSLQGSPRDYSSVEEIAGAWKSDRSNQIKYFLQNVAHGIHTFQDAAIRERLL
jgi:hypothetical protein